MNDERQEAYIASRWAEIVIERWQKKIAKYKIGSTGALVRSFTSAVEADAKGDVQKITFTYLYYGMFVDMGVGRGTKYSQRGTTKRQIKPWYSIVVRREIYKLGELMIVTHGGKVRDSMRLLDTPLIRD